MKWVKIEGYDYLPLERGTSLGLDVSFKKGCNITASYACKVSNPIGLKLVGKN